MKIFKNVAAVTLGVILSGSRLAEATLVDFTLLSGSGTPADPGLYTGGGSSLGQVVPDNTLAGVGYSINFGPAGLTISDISITLNLTGGYNGDLYAYLTHGSQTAVLFNQISGSAGSGSGFTSVRLIEGAGGTIQTASGTAGQALAAGDYTAQNNLNVFNNTVATGTWTLFIADMSPGDTSTLVSWGLDITVVPEPVTRALLIFAALGGGFWFGFWLKQKRAGGV